MTETLDNIFEAFGNKKRRAIVMSLAYRPATISQLAAEHGLSLPAINKHLKLLEQASLIHRRKSGRTNFIAFDRVAMQQAQEWILQFNTAWGSSQETLDNYIASLEQRT